eukprot:scaffold27062_cov139-Skeletonema_menzelii.AAC.7
MMITTKTIAMMALAMIPFIWLPLLPFAAEALPTDNFIYPDYTAAGDGRRNKAVTTIDRYLTTNDNVKKCSDSKNN